MNKFALTLVAAMAVPAVAFAADEMSKTEMTKTEMTKTDTMAKTDAMKKVELKDGSWAQISDNNMVKVSKDGGKTWTPAPDGTWEAKDGTKMTTKNGMKAM